MEGGPGWTAAVSRSYGMLRQCIAKLRHSSGMRRLVCGAKKFFRQILSGENGELRHLFCAIISAPGRAAVVHSAGGLVWSAGLISFCIRTKGAVRECRNDAARIRPAGVGADTERYGDGRCGRRRLVVCVDRAAQAEAEVERSEGEGEAQGRPVVGGRRACEERAVRRSAGVRVGGWSGGRLVCLSAGCRVLAVSWRRWACGTL